MSAEVTPNRCGGVVYLGSVHPPHTWTPPTMSGPLYYCDGGKR